MVAGHTGEAKQLVLSIVVVHYKMSPELVQIRLQTKSGLLVLGTVMMNKFVMIILVLVSKYF